MSCQQLIFLPQDEKLKRLVESGGGGEDWKQIANYFTDRSDVQCQHRWQKVLNPELIKGPWTKEVRNLYWKCMWKELPLVCSYFKMFFGVRDSACSR